MAKEPESQTRYGYNRTGTTIYDEDFIIPLFRETISQHFAKGTKRRKRIMKVLSKLSRKEGFGYFGVWKRVFSVVMDGSIVDDELKLIALKGARLAMEDTVRYSRLSRLREVYKMSRNAGYVGNRIADDCLSEMEEICLTAKLLNESDGGSDWKIETILLLLSENSSPSTSMKLFDVVLRLMPRKSLMKGTIEIFDVAVELGENAVEKAVKSFLEFIFLKQNFFQALEILEKICKKIHEESTEYIGLKLALLKEIRRRRMAFGRGRLEKFWECIDGNDEDVIKTAAIEILRQQIE